MVVESPPQRSLSIEELLLLPQNGMTRWLVRGKLRENPMTVRNRFQTTIAARMSYLLWKWLDPQPKPRGRVSAGEAGVILARNPDTVYGVDVVYFSSPVVAMQSDRTTLYEGIPTLVVEIGSPSDTREDTDDKIRDYLAFGVPLVWLIDPTFQTVMVFEPNTLPTLYNLSQTISAHPHLPGFQISVASIFED